MTTYSTKKPSSSNQERDQFLACFGQDAVVPNTSTPVRFSDHFGLGSSGVLPAGSMQDEFINHEPAMFRESGSTVPDNESSHERMVEQALRSNPKDTSSPGRIKLVESTEITKSSSFPWSASEVTESAKSNRVQTMQDAAAVGGTFTAEGSHPTPKQADNPHEIHASTVPDSNEVSGSGPTSAHAGLSNDQPAPPHSSPIVEIKMAKSTPAPAESPPDPAANAQKLQRGRKRKVQEESSEPLNSDDIAIGLPKERYKPRPSRRRATDVTEEPIDFSVIPERAARSKRAKTTGGGVVSTHAQPRMSTEKPSISTDQALETTEQTPNEEATVSAVPPKPSPVVEVPATISSQSQQATFATPAAPASQHSRESRKGDTNFAKATGKLKPISKSKRSSTTIFEDHVDFRGKQQSPSLSQQQAIRKSTPALEDIKNESTPAKPQRGRRVVVSDDDDEDELSHDPAPQEEPVKKRGRGRPPKSASKANANQSQKLVDELAGGDDTQNVAEEPPKKRRGRPPKNAAPAPTTDDNNATEAKVDSETHDPTEEQEANAEAEVKPTQEPTTTPSHPEEATKATPPSPQASTTTKIPTPCPSKQTPAPATENTTPTTGATITRPPTHSPIKKSSSPAPYRVGLSKKHRIPSLLRVMRPPPPKRG